MVLLCSKFLREDFFCFLKKNLLSTSIEGFFFFFLKGFPGGSVVKSSLATAGDMGSITCPGRSHMLWVNQTLEPRGHAPQ